MKKKRKVLGISLLLVAILTLIVFAAPGSDQDPLVTLSYVEQRLATLKQEILTELKGNSTGSTTVAAHPVFEIHNLTKGQKVTFGESAEFILRRGKAVVIDPIGNNIPDLTTGVDIKPGELVPLQHLLLVPRDDGRGFEVIENGVVMIKGPYKISD
jgi:hypothetical protein